MDGGKMRAQELRDKYIEYFIGKKHVKLDSASLIPENDASVLFTTAGMHPLVPYLTGEKHPKGKRLTSIQKCIRTNDIDEVGDLTHLTFFEMMGNWSLGDYFKEDSIKMSYEFLVDVLKMDKEKLAVTVFRGNDSVPRDEESVEIWKSLGIPEERIGYLGEDDNWWPKFGTQGIGGPDTEIFYWNGEGEAPKVYDSEDKNWVEIWNNVFTQYFTDDSGKIGELKNKNVDTGMGFERMLTILNKTKSVFATEIFSPIIQKIEEMTNLKYIDEIEDENTKNFRIIADHIRTSVMILGDKNGVVPSNVDQGYVLRRLIRRAIRVFKKLGVNNPDLKELAEILIDNYSENYSDLYSELKENKDKILTELENEEKTFSKTLDKGLKEVNKVLDELEKNNENTLSGKIAFRLYDTYGFPLEITEELALERNIKIDKEGFLKREKEHKEESKKGSEAKFAGGLLEDSEETRNLHTATHLLHKALMEVLGTDVRQRGSNITKERLRFDFSYSDKLTEDEKKRVEDIVNNAIKKDLEISYEEMTVDEALKAGAIGIFIDKYDEIVKVYKIGDFSMEICGGPHANRTSDLGHFKIIKEESSSKGVRRIKAILEKA